jgi:hypothetical protein
LPSFVWEALGGFYESGGLYKIYKTEKEAVYQFNRVVNLMKTFINNTENIKND